MNNFLVVKGSMCGGVFQNIPLLPKERNCLHGRDDLDTYSKEMQTPAIKLLYLMAKALGMEANDLEGMFEEGKEIPADVVDANAEEA